MKKVVLLFVLFVMVVFVSCDKVKKPYVVAREVVECDAPPFPVLDNVIQKYLLEDYTGHTCTNCPKAHGIIANDLSFMGDTLVVIAIHAGYNAEPEPGNGFFADYRTDAGNAYNSTFKINSYPSGMINRLFFNNNQIVPYSNWKNTLAGIPRKHANIGIQIMTEENGEKTCIFVKTTLLDGVLENLRLCVLLTEDSIISPQKFPGQDDFGNPIIDTNYVHNHVLRASIAPVWGDDIDISAKDESVINGYSILLGGQGWRKEHCHVVAFIYNLDNYEILQAESVKLVR